MTKASQCDHQNQHTEGAGVRWCSDCGMKEPSVSGGDVDFPDLAPTMWRTERPCIVTLVDGDRMPAYPVIGKINEDGAFCFGPACQDKMWLVADRMIESSLITECGQSRILALESVTHWQPLN